ncbi:Pbp2, partial [Pasteurella multocida subsp. multocida str. Anand1_buffalo]
MAAPVVRQIMDYYLTQRLPQISRLSPADSLA